MLDLVTLTTGDLATQRADVLVHGMTTDLLLGGDSFSLALLEPENAAIVAELYRVTGAKAGDVLFTPGGTLPAKALAHAIVTSELTPPTDNVLAAVLVRIFEFMDAKDLRTAAIPPLGTRLCHYTNAESAVACMRAVRHYGSRHPDTKLTGLTFILPYDADLPDWEQALESVRREEVSPAPSTGVAAAPGTETPVPAAPVPPSPDVATP